MKIRNRLVLPIAKVIVLQFFLGSYVVFGQSGIQEKLDLRIANWKNGKISTDQPIIDTELLAAINVDPYTNYSLILNDVVYPFSIEEYIYKREAWKQLSNENRKLATTVLVEHLSVAEEYRVKELHEIAKYSDFQFAHNQQWNFDNYRDILNITDHPPNERLIVCLATISPTELMHQYLSIYDSELGADFAARLSTFITEVENMIKTKSRLFRMRTSIDDQYKSGSDEIRLIEFLKELQERDVWFLDVFVASLLKKYNARNVSREIVSVFKSRPSGLAARIFEDSEFLGEPITDENYLLALKELYMGSNGGVQRGLEKGSGLEKGGLGPGKGGERKR